MASSRKVSKGSADYWLTYGEKRLGVRTIGAGYRAVSCKLHGAKHTFYVHRLVAEAFVPNPHGLQEVNHRDGNKANNHVANLQWVTHSDNLRHACVNGLIKRKSLTPELVREARALLAAGVGILDVAQRLDVGVQAVRHLKAGRTWTWLPG